MLSEYRLLLPDGEQISYRLERRTRRTIGLRIGTKGLIVHAPRRLSQPQLESALLQKADWIRKKLHQMRANQPPLLQWENGAELHYLGNPIRLRLSRDSANRKPLFEQGELHLRLTEIEDAASVAARVTQWYKKAALPDFARRLELFATRLGEPLPRLMLSSAQTRWGSCNSKREVRINWRLIQAPPSIINYVICHELAHLKEMNHSPRFWQVVEHLYPEYRVAERALKQLSPYLHRL